MTIDFTMTFYRSVLVLLLITVAFRGCVKTDEVNNFIKCLKNSY
jgi:hypothetical protein